MPIITAHNRRLDILKDVPFEQWWKAGVKLRAVAANANGIVSAGILHDGTYFYRKWNAPLFTNSWFEVER
jgi:hypothetical protein